MAVSTYRTIQGDAWDSVAFKVWAHLERPELMAQHLMQANPEHMDVLIFPAGVELIVPEVPQQQKTLDVPAWRK